MEAYVELRPHIGYTTSPLGPVAVEHDQWIAILHSDQLREEGRENGRQVGYLPKRDGARLLWEPYMREQCERGKVVEVVERLTDEARAKLAGGAE